MKLHVLVDNNTLIDRYFIGEPGLSFLIEAQGEKILFDTGYSDAFMINAKKMNIDLLDIDTVVISHNHLDHTWGLNYLIRLYTECRIEKIPFKKPALVTHPLSLVSRKIGSLPEIGPMLSCDRLERFFDLQLSKTPADITDRLVFLGEIPRDNSFEAQKPMGTVMADGRETDDYLADDSALVYKSAQGLVIITGCSHAGICNIAEYAKKVCNDSRIIEIIGGFHLLNTPEKQMRGTLDYMKKLNPGCVHACHCTDLNAKIALSEAVDLKEVGVGLCLEFAD